MTASAVRVLNDPQSPTNILVGRGHILAALERWVRGELVHAQSGRGGYLKRLESPPREIWEIRVTQPVTHARLFVRFARPNTLVMTHLRTRGSLGKKIVRGTKSDHWAKALSECETEWDRLFPGHQPFSANGIHEYITENCDDFDLAD